MSGSSVAAGGGSVATEQDVLLPTNFALWIMDMKNGKEDINRRAM